MHAYFPALNSYPSLLGDMLADGINCLGFTWVTCFIIIIDTRVYQVFELMHRFIDSKKNYVYQYISSIEQDTLQ